MITVTLPMRQTSEELPPPDKFGVCHGLQFITTDGEIFCGRYDSPANEFESEDEEWGFCACNVLAWCYVTEIRIEEVSQ